MKKLFSLLFLFYLLSNLSRAQNDTICKAFFDFYQDSVISNNVFFINKSISQFYQTYWDFGDGTVSNDTNPTHNYADTGSYNVCLTIIDSLDNCKDTYCQPVIITGFVQPVSCKASFYLLGDSMSGNNTIKFINTSSSNSNNYIYKYKWDFGDGKTSEEINPVHTYPEPDYYNICLYLDVYSDSNPLIPVCSSEYCLYDILTGNPSFYILGGQVFLDKFPVSRAKAYIYRHKVNDNYLLTDSMSFDTLGYYYFYKLMAGNYIVKILPDKDNFEFLPTYYGDVTTWNEAKAITLNKDIYNADIELKSLVNTVNSTAKGQIQGYIYNTIGSSTNLQILLSDSIFKPLSFTFTNSKGFFRFNNIQNGKYFITIDEPGLIFDTLNVTIDQKNNNIEVNIYNDSVKYNSAVPYSKYAIAGTDLEIFPNPVKNQLNIIYKDNFNQNPNLYIFNMTGNMVFSTTLNKNTTQLNIEQLEKGIYFIRLKFNNGKYLHSKIIKL
ncbi:MAG: PKD domain-containing protein [Bacteroidales bacterium]|nr:PKD domain-containing protein [Bacteroidales bacterium]